MHSTAQSSRQAPGLGSERSGGSSDPRVVNSTWLHHESLQPQHVRHLSPKAFDLLELLLPAYVAEGKAYLTVALGCTGGRHRSVAIAEEVGRRLRAHGARLSVLHRDIEK